MRKNGTTEEYIRLLQSYEQAMYKVAYGILGNEEDCQDAMQEALWRAYANRYTVREVQYFKTWLLRITIHECQRIYKKKKAFIHPIEMLGKQTGVKQLELKLDLHTALDGLEKKYKEPLVLYYFADCSYEEIAKVMKLPIGTIKSRMYYGKKRLRERLGEDYA